MLGINLFGFYNLAPYDDDETLFLKEKIRGVYRT